MLTSYFFSLSSHPTKLKHMQNIRIAVPATQPICLISFFIKLLYLFSVHNKYIVSFRCYNTSEKVCLQGLFHAIFQQKRRFGKDKAHGNGSCRQNSILSRFDVIISSTQTYCQYVCKNFTLFFSRKYIKMASGIRKIFPNSARVNIIISSASIIIK